MDEGNPLLPLYLGLGLSTCIVSMLSLSNAMALFNYLRFRGEEGGSTLSMIAWALSLAGLFFVPCSLFTALIGILLSSIEKSKVYRDEASPMSLVACQMALFDSIGSVAIFVILTIALIITYL